MNFSKRITAFQVAMYGLMISLAVSLFQTQVAKGGTFRRLGEYNRIRLIPVPAPRGKIFDRGGLLFATNRPAYHVYLTPEDFDPADLPLLSK